MTDDENERMFDDATISAYKRAIAPEGFGDECPVCGEPFDPGSSGALWSDTWSSVDVVSWVRMCSGPLGEGVDLSDAFYASVREEHDFPPESVPFIYVHKDEHIDVLEATE